MREIFAPDFSSCGREKIWNLALPEVSVDAAPKLFKLGIDSYCRWFNVGRPGARNEQFASPGHEQHPKELPTYRIIVHRGAGGKLQHTTPKHNQTGLLNESRAMLVSRRSNAEKEIPCLETLG